MCMSSGGSNQASPPPPPPAPNPAPNMGSTQAGAAAKSTRDRAMGAQGFGSTIVTGASGLTTPESTAKKSLLGGSV